MKQVGVCDTVDSFGSFILNVDAKAVDRSRFMDLKFF